MSSHVAASAQSWRSVVPIPYLSPCKAVAGGDQKSTRVLAHRFSCAREYLGASNSGPKRRHKGALPLVGESELRTESELKTYAKSRLNFRRVPYQNTGPIFHQFFTTLLCQKYISSSMARLHNLPKNTLH
jgi:hypothetical protein